MSDIRYARTARMLDDPDLGGDLLLVGLALARFLDFDPPGEKVNVKQISRACFPRASYRPVKRIFEMDARTYRPPQPSWSATCEAPMIRRDGPCGQHATGHGYLTDWDTGEQEGIWSCARHHAWRMDLIRRNTAAKPQRLPLPAANHGGVLAKHFPEIDWPKIWEWATGGRWVEHPEVEPWKPPTLTLHLGDGADTGRLTRPMLAPVEAS
jgi:hypothetical protein